MFDVGVIVCAGDEGDRGEITEGGELGDDGFVDATCAEAAAADDDEGFAGIEIEVGFESATGFGVGGMEVGGDWDAGVVSSFGWVVVVFERHASGDCGGV